MFDKGTNTYGFYYSLIFDKCTYFINLMYRVYYKEGLGEPR